MRIEQVINIATILVFSLYVVAKESQISSKLSFLIVMGLILVLAQFVFNKIFLISTSTKEILLLIDFTFDNSLVVLGYALIASGLLGYVKSFLNRKKK